MEVLEEVEVGLEEDLLCSDEYADEINRRIAEIKVTPEIGIPFEEVCAEIRQAYGFQLYSNAIKPDIRYKKQK